MIFHLLFNSLLVFVLLTFLVESILWLFRINNSRMRYFCRLIPVFKLPFDLAVFAFFDPTLINFNPLSCQLYLQELLFPNWVQIELHGLEKVILPGYVASFIPSAFLHIFILGVVCTTIGISFWKIFRLTQSMLILRKLIKSSTPATRAIQNVRLQKQLIESRAVILISSEIEMPFAVGHKYILFPSHLILSQEEYEAVLTHELEHVRWKDPLVKLFYTSVCTLCWWLPTNWWTRRLELDQELASDEGVTGLGLDQVTFATALLKVVRQAKPIPYEAEALCALVPSQKTHYIRLENILNQTQPSHPAAMGAAIFLSILGGFCFWMC